MRPLSDDDVSEILFSLVTDRQLDEYLDWSTTEDALDGDVADHNTFLFSIMTEDQVGEFVDIEREYYDDSKDVADEYYVHTPDEYYGPYDSLTDAEDALERLEEKGIEILGITRGKDDWMDAESFAAPIPYGRWHGACIFDDGRCWETTMEECRLLGGRFQGPDTRCNPDGGIPVSMAAEDKTVNGTEVPKEIREYLVKHPEVANLYDDDDAGVLLKGLIIGVLIGALGTVVGNVASEFVTDTLRATPELKHNT